MSTHSSRWNEHETNCSKVCSLSLEQWPARSLGWSVHRAAKKVRHDPNFLSRVITGDESWLYRKQSSSLRNWRSHPLHDRKKHAKFAATSSQCWSFFFLTFEELCIRSLFHLVRISMGSFTARFWDDWGKMWDANSLDCGRTKTSCCTMTMCLHTPRSWGNSWQKITWPLFPTLPTDLTWPPTISTCSLKWNSRWKGGISYPSKRSKQNCNRY